MTLFRDDPPPQGSDAIPTLRQISYEEEILLWLELCRKEVANLPAVREAISQYINLIKDLTNQNISKQMNQELISHILGSRDNLKAYFALHKSENDLRNTILQKLDRDINSIADRVGLRRCNGDDDISQGFNFETDKLINANVNISFYFEKSNYRECYFGFCKMDVNKECPIAERLAELFNQRFQGYSPTEWWPAYALWHDYQDWHFDVLEKIQFGELQKDLEDLCKQLAEIAEEAVK